MTRRKPQPQMQRFVVHAAAISFHDGAPFVRVGVRLWRFQATDLDAAKETAGDVLPISVSRFIVTPEAGPPISVNLGFVDNEPSLGKVVAE